MTGPITFSGLSSGLNSTAIINAEMAVFDQPLNDLKAQQSTLNSQIQDYQTINSQLTSLQSAALALASPSDFSQAYAVTSTDSAVASATVTSAANAGSLTLAVDQLAQNSTEISSGTVSSTAENLGASSFLIGTGGAALGIQSFSGATGLASGTHAISVTQSSEAATLTGTSSLPSSTTISSANNSLNLLVNGTAQTLTLDNGTYTASQLAAAITSASSGTLTGSVNSQGQLQLATTQQGSSATLQVIGGSAQGALGISVGGQATGQDGIISVDGTSTTVSDINGSGTTAVTLNSGSGGSVVANVSGGLVAGTMTAHNIAVGSGSLADVVSAVNASGLGITASALQVGTDQYALEITANATGTSSSATVDTTAFSGSNLGTLNTTVAAQNAEVSIGGAGGYQVTSQTNSFSGLLQGVDVQVSQVSTNPVTINVAADGSQVASDVSTLVNAANTVLSTISTDTAYNVATGTAGPLNGAYSLTALAQKILATVGQAVGNSAAGGDGTAGESAGLSITSSGQIAFNQAAFIKAYNANPTGVQSMFTEGGSFTGDTGPGHTVANSFPPSSIYAGLAQVVGADTNAIPGTYIVAVSQSAKQASVLGSANFLSATSQLASAENYTITSGSASATVAITAGETLKDVVNGLNSQLASAGIGATATLISGSNGEQVQVSSNAYGSAASFAVSTSGSDQLGIASNSPYVGTDVAGTINGVAATGSGQMLTATGTTNPANGLVMQISAEGITSPTTIGTVTYAPGLAQTLEQIGQQASTPGEGVQATITGLQSTLTQVDRNIASQQQLSNTQLASLQQEYANLEQTLAKLNSQTQFLNALNGSSSSSSSSSGLSGASSSSSSIA